MCVRPCVCLSNVLILCRCLIQIAMLCFYRPSIIHAPDVHPSFYHFLLASWGRTEHNKETVRGQLMTYTKQFLFSPTFIHPACHPYVFWSYLLNQHLLHVYPVYNDGGGVDYVSWYFHYWFSTIECLGGVFRGDRTVPLTILCIFGRWLNKCYERDLLCHRCHWYSSFPLDATGLVIILCFQ